MRKIKTVVSSATLLSVGGVGLLSYEKMMDPTEVVETSETYIGLDELEYNSIEEASKTFISEHIQKYVIGGMEFYEYEEYEQYQMDLVEDVEVFNIDGEMYISKSDVHFENETSSHYQFLNEFYSADEVSRVVDNMADEYIEYESYYVIVSPLYSQPSYFSADPGGSTGGGSPTLPDNTDPSVNIVDYGTEFDQNVFEMEKEEGIRLIVPSSNHHEIAQIQTGNGKTCSSDSMYYTFDREIDCSDIRVDYTKVIFKDKDTLETSEDYDELFVKRRSQLWTLTQQMFKFRNNYYNSVDHIDEYIESKRETMYLWNDYHYTNKAMIENSILVQFNDLKDEALVEETLLCNGHLIDTNIVDTYVYNNYEMLVNQCIYGNIYE